MKNRTLTFIVAALVLTLAMCAPNPAQAESKTGDFRIVPLVGVPLDYSDRSNWMHFDDNDDKDHKVDLFFLYPTSVSSECSADVSEVDNAMKHRAELNYLKNGHEYSSYTNVYVPYYRQITGAAIIKCTNADKLMEMCRNNVTRTDVYAALDYYFENCNKGKPYILAGHSQGSCNLKLVLSEYMRLHPEYLDRMVACYAIGYYFPDSWFKENPHVKKAKRETDWGVLVSWNTEGPGASLHNLPVGDGSFCINPLNWKTDETPAGVDKNKGSVDVDAKTLRQTFVKGKADATINLTRGSIICTTYSAYIPSNVIFGDKSFHFEDVSMYYQNLKENGKKRIESYFKDHK